MPCVLLLLPTGGVALKRTTGTRHHDLVVGGILYLPHLASSTLCSYPQWTLLKVGEAQSLQGAGFSTHPVVVQFLF